MTKTITAKALWYTHSGSRIEAREISPSSSRDILLSAQYSCLSLGTENLIRKGSCPPRLRKQMEVPYMEGTFDLPVKYGYAMVAADEEGNIYHLMHPHQDMMYVSKESLYALPSNFSAKRAALISNVETCLNAIWDAELQSQDKVAIIGYGGIGSLLAQTLRTYSGVTASIYDHNEYKQALALKNGFRVMDDDKSYDIIFHTSANGSGLQSAIDHAGREGRVIEMSWYGDTPTTLHLGANFHVNRIKIISSQVSTVSPYAPGSGYLWRKEQCVEVLKDPSFDKLITLVPFEEVVRWWDSDSDGLIVVIGY